MSLDEKPGISVCRKPCAYSNNWLFIDQRIVAASSTPSVYSQPDKPWYGVISDITAIDDGQAESRKSA